MNSNGEITCEECKYYDSEDAVCMAFGCYPIDDCDKLLPCEIGEEQEVQG